LPRKTDSNNPADWIFIVDSDWPQLRRYLEQVEAILAKVKSRLPADRSE